MATRKRLDLSLSKIASAVTNGSALLAGQDHRSAELRRLRDLVHLHVADLGGEANMSHAEMALVRRASMLILQLEMMEQRWAATNDCEATGAQLDLYQRGCGSLRRLLETLGLARRPGHLASASTEYLTGHQRAGEGISLDDAQRDYDRAFKERRRLAEDATP